LRGPSTVETGPAESDHRRDEDDLARSIVLGGTALPRDGAHGRFGTAAEGGRTVVIGELNDYAALLLGLACAGIGGEVSVRGIVGIAEWLRISPGIIGATVAAFATSSPELAVAIASAAQGAPQISFGDVLGSNMVNVARVLGTALLFLGISVCVVRCAATTRWH
jgi:Ca2+/Na+ antiporter